MTSDRKLWSGIVCCMAHRLNKLPNELHFSVPHWAACREFTLASIFACLYPDVALPQGDTSRARLVALLRWDALRPEAQGSAAAALFAGMVVSTPAGSCTDLTLAMCQVLREAFPPEEPAMHELLRSFLDDPFRHHRPELLSPEARALFAFVGFTA